MHGCNIVLFLPTDINNATIKQKSTLKDFVYSIKADFHSVQNVTRSTFSKRFLLKCVKATTATENCSA